MELWKSTVIFAVLIFESAVFSEENKQTTTTIPVDKSKANITTEKFITKTKNDSNKIDLINTTPQTSSTTEKNHDTTNEKDETEDTGGLFFLTTEDGAKLVYTLEESNDTKVPDNATGSKLFNDTIIDKIYLFDQFYGNVNGTKSEIESVGIVSGNLAAILAAVFLIISIIGYIMILSWRRYLENRYGNRELLVENDYCEKMSKLEEFDIEKPSIATSNQRT